MLVRDANQRMAPGQNVEAHDAYSRLQNNKENWLEFCMFPDLIEPVRMPSLFPIPTHIVKRQEVFTIQPTSNTIYAMWKPHTLDDGSESTVQQGFKSLFIHGTTAPASNADDHTFNSAQNAIYSRAYTPSLDAVPGLVHGGARMIGAFIEIEYIGTIDQHAGLIEVGLHMHSANSAVDLVKVHTYNQAEIIQAPFYRKFKPMDGARCVWFPVDDDAFNFQDFDVSAAGIGEGDPSAAVNIPERLAQIKLRSPVYPEWCINFSGLSANQGIRVHMCSFYETVPEEHMRDLFMARKTTIGSNISALKSAVTSAVQSEMVSTPAKSSNSWGHFRDKAKMFIDGLATTYQLYKDSMSVISMFK